MASVVFVVPNRLNIQLSIGRPLPPGKQTERPLPGDFLRVVNECTIANALLERCFGLETRLGLKASPEPPVRLF